MRKKYPKKMSSVVKNVIFKILLFLLILYLGPRMLKDLRSMERIILTLTQESPTSQQNKKKKYFKNNN